MQQNVTYSYLVAWILGGLILLTTVVLRTQRRPHALSFALIGYGAMGFLSLGFGLAHWTTVWIYAVIVGLLSGSLGYVVQVVLREPAPRLELPPFDP